MKSKNELFDTGGYLGLSINTLKRRNIHPSVEYQEADYD
jgi:hypothetical protein